MTDIKHITEKERRWILRKKPFIEWHKELHITQYYIDGIRYRRTFDIAEGILTYEKIKKVSIAPGHNEEIDIEEISCEIWEGKEGQAERTISKSRFVYEANGLKFELDEFDFLNLIILEIEGVELEDKIEFPTEIQNEVVFEITGIKEFNNYNLAK